MFSKYYPNSRKPQKASNNDSKALFSNNLEGQHSKKGLKINWLTEFNFCLGESRPILTLTAFFYAVRVIYFCTFDLPKALFKQEHFAGFTC